MPFLLLFSKSEIDFSHLTFSSSSNDDVNKFFFSSVSLIPSMLLCLCSDFYSKSHFHYLTLLFWILEAFFLIRSFSSSSSLSKWHHSNAWMLNDEPFPGSWVFLLASSVCAKSCTFSIDVAARKCCILSSPLLFFLFLKCPDPISTNPRLMLMSNN